MSNQPGGAVAASACSAATGYVHSTDSSAGPGPAGVGAAELAVDGLALTGVLGAGDAATVMLDVEDADVDRRARLSTAMLLLLLLLLPLLRLRVPTAGVGCAAISWWLSR